MTKVVSKGLSYDDVLLIPERSEVNSRSDVDLRIELAGLELEVPIITANMDTITEDEMAIAVAQEGGLGVIHRFTPIERQAQLVQRVKAQDLPVGASLGLQGYIEDARRLIGAGADLLVLDVAHGHMERVIEATRKLRDTFPEVRLAAGNVVTRQAVRDLADAGADIIKVGVGPGSMCTTRQVAGAGFPQFSAVLDCSRAAREHERDVAIIADGGITKSGDIVKALGAGAQAVMIGGLFAGCQEAPGEVIEVEGEQYKQARGMASLGAAKTNGKDTDNYTPEGVSTLKPLNGSARKVLNNLAWGTRSGLSYAGTFNVADFQRVSRFVQKGD